MAQDVGLGVGCTLLAYVAGSVPFSYLAALLMGHVDIRRTGAGNVGAYNVLRQAGVPAALIATAGDVGKGAFAVNVVRWVDAPEGALFPAVLGAVMGHIWPVFLGFQGGRGVATAFGAAVALLPLHTLAGVGAGLAAGLPVRYPPAGALAAMIVLNTLVIITGEPLGKTLLILSLTIFVAATHVVKKLLRPQPQRTGGWRWPPFL